VEEKVKISGVEHLKYAKNAKKTSWPVLSSYQFLVIKTRYVDSYFNISFKKETKANLNQLENSKAPKMKQL